MPAAALKSLATRMLGQPEPQLDARLLERKVVVLMQGHNSSGDAIYAYIELTMANLRLLRSKRLAGEDINPMQFGTVVQAGSGKPIASIAHDIASKYDLVSLS